MSVETIEPTTAFEVGVVAASLFIDIVAGKSGRSEELEETIFHGVSVIAFFAEYVQISSDKDPGFVVAVAALKDVGQVGRVG